VTRSEDKTTEKGKKLNCTFVGRGHFLCWKRRQSKPMVTRRRRTLESSIPSSCDLGISWDLKEYPMMGGGGNVYIMQDSSLNTTKMKYGFHPKNVCAN